MDSIGNSKISVCIPCYDMKGRGSGYLEESMYILEKQTFKNFEVVVSDHSLQEEKSVEKVCDKFKNRGLDVKYFRNIQNIGNSSANLNNCFLKSSGEIIKIIFQDDFLYHQGSLQDISESFEKNPEKYWLVTSCCHLEDGKEFSRFIDPVYTDDILTGNNKISSPSVLSFRNTKDNLFFDPNFIWLMDCDYYYRLKQKFGDPFYLEKTNVVNRLWGGQLTKNIPGEIMDFEHSYILKKHNYGPNQ